MIYKACLCYKNGAEAIELLDIGIGRTCQPVIPYQ